MGCDSYPWGFEMVGVCPIQPHTEDWKFKYAAAEMNLVASDVRVWRGHDSTCAYTRARARTYADPIGAYPQL